MDCVVICILVLLIVWIILLEVRCIMCLVILDGLCSIVLFLVWEISWLLGW